MLGSSGPKNIQTPDHIPVDLYVTQMLKDNDSGNTTILSKHYKDLRSAAERYIPLPPSDIHILYC